jgi:ribosomal protein S28E/S33
MVLDSYEGVPTCPFDQREGKRVVNRIVNRPVRKRCVYEVRTTSREEGGSRQVEG